MANKQKAWRKAGKGRANKAGIVKVLPFASTLFQCLLLRAEAVPIWHGQAESDEYSRALDAELGLVPA